MTYMSFYFFNENFDWISTLNYSLGILYFDNFDQIQFILIFQDHLTKIICFINVYCHYTIVLKNFQVIIDKLNYWIVSMTDGIFNLTIENEINPGRSYY